MYEGSVCISTNGMLVNRNFIILCNDWLSQAFTVWLDSCISSHEPCNLSTLNKSVQLILVLPCQELAICIIDRHNFSTQVTITLYDVHLSKILTYKLRRGCVLCSSGRTATTMLILIDYTCSQLFQDNSWKNLSCLQLLIMEIINQSLHNCNHGYDRYG